MTEVRKPSVVDVANDIDLSSLSIAERLPLVLAQRPDIYEPEVVARVTRLVQYETDHPERKKRYVMLQSVDDFALYTKLHPEWSGKTLDEMQHDRETGGVLLYSAWNRFLRGTEMSLDEKREATKKLFTYKKNSWKGFSSYNDWESEYHKHPEWNGKTGLDMREDQETGGYEFHKAYTKWVNSQTSDREERRNLIRKLFPRKVTLKRWNTLDTIDKWREEYNQHPEWSGKSSGEVGEMDKDGRNFHVNFIRWVNKNTKDRRERAALIDAIFTRKVKDWTVFTTLEDWIAEFKAHPEWEGRNTAQVAKGSNYGSVFYDRFMTWVKNHATTFQEREAYIHSLFPNTKVRQTEELQQIPPDEAEEDIMKLI